MDAITVYVRMRGSRSSRLSYLDYLVYAQWELRKYSAVYFHAIVVKFKKYLHELDTTKSSDVKPFAVSVGKANEVVKEE